MTFWWNCPAQWPFGFLIRLQLCLGFRYYHLLSISSFLQFGSVAELYSLGLFSADTKTLDILTREDLAIYFWSPWDPGLKQHLFFMWTALLEQDLWVFAGGPADANVEFFHLTVRFVVKKTLQVVACDWEPHALSQHGHAEHKCHTFPALRSTARMGQHAEKHAIRGARCETKARGI